MHRSSKKTRSLVLAFFVAFACVFAAGCDDVVSDPTFRDWCGDQLCSWKLEGGSVRKVPTWHKKDYGVELTDATPSGPTILSQETKDSPKCLEVTMVADVAPSAQVSFGLDFNLDGTTDYEQPIVASGFREVKSQLTAPSFYSGIRFVITKRGAGRAVLAQMRVQSKQDCVAPPLELKAQPLWTPCGDENGDECSSGVCCNHVCAECCAPSADSTAPQWTFLGPRVECGGGGDCRPRFAGAVLQCDPAKGVRGPGAQCVDGADCASGVCDGARAEGEMYGKKDPNGPDDLANLSVTPCVPNLLQPDTDPAGCHRTLVRGGRCR